MVNFRKLLGREKKEPEVDPLLDYTLGKMKVGFLVDYDLKTWQVTGTTDYDYDGDEAQEWQLTSGGGDVRFLERAEEDGKVDWTLTCRISLRDVEGDVGGTILDEGEPPEQVVYDGTHYRAEESSPGTMVEMGASDETANEREFVSWSYGSSNDRVLFVVQTGDRDFAVYEGEYVQEYQFTNILPAG